MSNYSKTTNFLAKDALISGDPLKVIKGSEHDTEYTNIATAIATKADASGTVITSGSINGTTIGNTSPSTGAFTTATATTSVTAPLVTSAGALLLSSGGAGALQLSSATGTVSCNSDNTTVFGSAVLRWITGFFTSIDSGSGSLVLKGAGATALTATGANLTAAGTIQAASTIGVGAATPSASGAGISFPAAQSASTDVNTLDDYEEGTWTPSLGGNATYTTQTGTYTKIGRMVFVTGTLQINSIGTGSTTVISGLPFTPSPTNQGTITVGETQGLATAVVSIAGRTSTAPDSIEIRSRTVASSSDGGNAAFTNATLMRFGGCYST